MRFGSRSWKKTWDILAVSDSDFLALTSCLQLSGNDCSSELLQETWDLFQKALNKRFYWTLQDVDRRACGDLKLQTQALLKTIRVSAKRLGR